MEDWVVILQVDMQNNTLLESTLTLNSMPKSGAN